MFFSFIRNIVHALLLLVNGRIEIQNKENLPKDETYIIIAPHKSILDPVFIALAASPRQFTFMAKEELFKKPIIAWFLRSMNAFSVNRQKPGPSALKTPIKRLKNTDLSLIMFPTGTRHSKDIKGGATTIAKMSKKKIVPAIYEGPFSIGQLFTRKQTKVRFGEPFTVEKKLENIENVDEYYSQKIQESFSQLEEEITK